MRQKIIVFSTLTLALSTSALALTNAPNPQHPGRGIFASGNLGWGKIDLTKSTHATGFSNSGFAQNANLGYQFGKYVAIESGYTHFANVTNDTALNNDTVKTYGIDLLVKGILPITEQFNVFAKAGAMYLHTSATDNNVLFGTGPSIAFHRYVPEFGLGTSYNVNQHIALTVQGIRTLAVKGSGTTGTNSITMPATWLALAGVSYKFNV